MKRCVLRTGRKGKTPNRGVRPAGLVAAAGLLLLLALFTSCGGGDRTLTIADQYGIAYLPVQIVKQEKLLEKRLPDTRIRWEKMGNAAAIREAMIAEKLDVGFMGIPPFLIGYDRGMDWRIFTGLSESPLGLVTLREDIQSLDDIGPEDRIALPQPGSIQHILLSMAAERRFGDPGRFDSRLVTLSHPDGMQALLAGREITAHFTSPPFL
ncbi:MAG: ABC transporter substrate-binding protein, partial [Spirochaetia bacterium]